MRDKRLFIMGLRATCARIRVLWRLRITGVLGYGGKGQLGIRAIRAKGQEGLRATGFRAENQSKS